MFAFHFYKDARSHGHLSNFLMQSFQNCYSSAKHSISS